MCNQCRRDSEQVAVIELPDLHIQFQHPGVEFFSPSLSLSPTFVLHDSNRRHRWKSIDDQCVRSLSFGQTILFKEQPFLICYHYLTGMMCQHCESSANRCGKWKCLYTYKIHSGSYPCHVQLWLHDIRRHSSIVEV